MPEGFTGILGGMLGIQAFEQEQAQRQATTQHLQMENQKLQTEMGAAKAQQDIIANFLKQGAQEQQAQQAQQGQVQRQQQAQQQPEDMQIALGQELFKRGFPEQGDKYMKQGYDTKKQKAQALKDQQLERKDSIQANTAIAKERGREFSGLTENPTKEEYNAVLDEIKATTGSLPDWVTGDPVHDKPFYQQEARAFRTEHNRGVARAQNGMTFNEYGKEVESLNERGRHTAKPIQDTLLRTQNLRTLLQTVGPDGKPVSVADKEVLAGLQNLYQSTRGTGGTALYGKVTNYGGAINRIGRVITGIIDGTITDKDKHEVGAMLDYVDKNLYIPAYQNIVNQYKKQAVNQGFKEDVVTFGDFTANLGGTPEAAKGNVNVGNQKWLDVGPQGRSQAVTMLKQLVDQNKGDDKAVKKLKKQFKETFGHLPPGY